MPVYFQYINGNPFTSLQDSNVQVTVTSTNTRYVEVPLTTAIVWSALRQLLYGLLYDSYCMVCCMTAIVWFAVRHLLYGLLYDSYCMVCSTTAIVWSAVRQLLYGMLYDPETLLSQVTSTSCAV